MSDNTVSVIIPNYNGLNYLKNCLSSIEKNIDLNIILIIVDNGSDSETVDFLKNINQKSVNIENKSINKIFTINYNILFNKNNLGFAKAVNQGIILSKQLDIDFTILLNNDVEIESNYFSNLLHIIKSEDKIFSVSSKMLRWDNKNIIDDAGDDYTLLGWTLKNGDGKSKEKFSKDCECFSACGGAAIYRLSTFDEIGLFDEKFFLYLEDVDIGYRAKIVGYKNLYTSKAIVYHRVSGTTGSKYNKFKTKISARNNIYLIYKNMPWIQIIINIGFIVIGFLIKYLFFYKKGFGKLYSQGIIEAIKDIRIGKIKKIEFNFKHLKNYILIEYLLIKNTFKLVFSY
ncbi:MAG: glycosyltransferase family 2 protein, partial [Methanobrevibacter sp.]|nr:glycosyltransferase family 2 protein [Candidatus Methanoflexus mossambicus]